MAIYYDYAELEIASHSFAMTLRYYANVSLRENCRVSPSQSQPMRKLPKLHPADRRLHLRHPPVRPEGFMQPAKTGRMLPVIHGVKALPVIFIGPDFIPYIMPFCSDHPRGLHNCVSGHCEAQSAAAILWVINTL